MRPTCGTEHPVRAGVSRSGGGRPGHLLSATLVVLGAVMSACADNGTSGTSTTTSAATSSTLPGGSLTPEQMKAALVGPTDLGAGWIGTQTEAFTTRSGIPTVDPGIWCPTAADQMSGLGDLAGTSGAITGLRKTGVGQGRSDQVSEQIFVSQDPSTFVSTIKSGFDSCDGTKWTNTEGGTVRIDASSGDSRGDVSTASTSVITTKDAGVDFAFRTRMSVVSVGDVVMIVQETDTQKAGSAPLMSDADWNRLVDTATGRSSDL